GGPNAPGPPSTGARALAMRTRGAQKAWVQAGRMGARGPVGLFGRTSNDPTLHVCRHAAFQRPASDWDWRAGLEQPNPTKRRSSVSTEQRDTLDAILRQSAFPVGSDVPEQRRLLREAISAQPLPADVTVTAAALGDVPT